MTKIERKSFLFINLVILAIGIIYFIFKYFMLVESNYGPRPHELTATWLHWHVMSVPLVVLALGYLLPIHIIPKLKKSNQERQKSGIFLILCFIIMIISGYLLQMGFSQSFNISAGWIHSIISLVSGVALFWHSRFRF